jgi:predicted nuclease of restriction endonuclease-like (RecB) superfamily
MDDSIPLTDYTELVDSIKQTIAGGRLRAARAVNNVLVESYWEIGRDIVARQQEQGSGARVVERLSADLRAANPGARGLSVRNLRYMRALARRWPAGIVQQRAAQLPWGHLMVILDNCPDRETSEFYARRAVDEGWTRGALQSMIASRLHERAQPAPSRFGYSAPEADQDTAREIAEDPFVLDFLAAEMVRERDLSKALADSLTRYLLELGTGFAFVGAEVPVPSGDREFVIGLLFYHYRLHRFVAFELELNQFEPEYIGKLNFQVQLIDDQLRDQAHDEPTLGMLLVVDGDDVTVEVALRGIATPLAVTDWRRLPDEVRQWLPSAEDLTETITRTVREIGSSTVA